MAVKIIFRRNWMPGSYLIRMINGGPYSHCGIVDTEKNTVIEAAWPKGVIETPLAEFTSGYCSWEIREFPGDEAKTLEAVRTQMGKPYDTFGLFGFAVRDYSWTDTSSWICSELSTWAYLTANYPNFDSAATATVSPNDLYRISNLLSLIKDK